MEWLERHYKEDFFLCIDTWDPHEPWEAPNYYVEQYWPDYDGEIIQPRYSYWQDVPGLTEEHVKKAHATYCGEITMVDTWIGYLLRRVENMALMENTAIIFTSDHGFYFGEHGGLFGKMCFAKRPDGRLYAHGEEGSGWDHSPLYEELVSIPLLIYIPGVVHGVYSGLTSAVDLMPTIVDILGAKIPNQVEGRSLLPMMRDKNMENREFVVSSIPFANPGGRVRYVDHVFRNLMAPQVTTITTEEWSLLYSSEPGKSELFHLPSDPQQLKNILVERPEKAKELHQLLVNFMHKTNLAPELIESRFDLQFM
jgi:arylsulfatase A-like enzyme